MRLNMLRMSLMSMLLLHIGYAQAQEEKLPARLQFLQGKWITENDDGTISNYNTVGNKSYYLNSDDKTKIDSSYKAFCDDCEGIEYSDYDFSRLKINNDSGSCLMIDSLFCYYFSISEDSLSYQLNWTHRQTNIIVYKRLNKMHPGAKRGIIKAEKSYIYSQPSKEQPSNKYMVRFDEIEILGKQGDFTQIKFYGKKDIIGWIDTNDIWK